MFSVDVCSADSCCVCVHRKDEKEYALKQIEGTGISMSACREIAVSYSNAYVFNCSALPRAIIIFFLITPQFLKAQYVSFTYSKQQ